MEISQTTIAILKKFARIQQSVMVRTGNEIGTISTGKNAVAYATVEESFPVDFGIYDLNEFLNVIAMFEEPDFTFKDQFVVIKEKGSKRKITYVYGDESIIISPEKRLSMPKDSEINFVLTDETLADLMKASTVLKLPNIVVSGNSKNGTIAVTDVEESSCNNFSLPIGKDVATGSYEMVSNVEYWNGFLEGSYDVSMSSKKIAMFTHQTYDFVMWISLEKDSTYSE